MRFFYLQSTSFAGRVIGTAYGINRNPRTLLSGPRLTRLLYKTAHRLERVQLECRPYEEVLRRFDREDTLFYCDPPYIGRRTYPNSFTAADYKQLADRLSGLRARFMLSINDHPLARTAFGRFACREITVRYSASPTTRNRVIELIFANYDLDAAAASAPSASTPESDRTR